MSWMRSTTVQPAHYFDHNGRSLCHLWMQTTQDKPAPQAPRCPICQEARADAS